MEKERADRIIALRESGCTYKQISERLDIHKCTIDKVLKKKLAVKFQSKFPYQLSKREVDVARLLLVGKSVKLIAESLGLKVKTVDSHIGMIYIKLGINNDPTVCKRSVTILKLKDLL